jgi:purine-binding chemotaxis protein CheW
MNKLKETLLCFDVDNQRFAVPVSVVERIIRAVAVTHVPDAKDIFYGMMDFHGQVIPVINLRKRFNLTKKPLEVIDRFLIAKTEAKRFALVVDQVEGIIKVTSQDINNIEMPADDKLKHHAGQLGLEIMKFVSDEKGIIIIYDIEKLLGSEAAIEIHEFFKDREE